MATTSDIDRVVSSHDNGPYPHSRLSFHRPLSLTAAGAKDSSLIFYFRYPPRSRPLNSHDSIVRLTISVLISRFLTISKRLERRRGCYRPLIHVKQLRIRHTRASAFAAVLSLLSAKFDDVGPCYCLLIMIF